MGAAAAVLSIVVSLPPIQDVACDTVDLVEVNHFYDEQGRLVFDQIIFYDWCGVQCRYNVRAWRLLKKPAQIPLKNYRRNEYEAVWFDGVALRKVRTAVLRETWTQHDPELVERDYLPKEKRRDLAAAPAKSKRR